MKWKRLVFLSVFLQMIAFPRFDLSWFAWVSLVPLLIAIQKSRNIRNAFKISCFCGFFFFLGSIFWLRYVTWAGFLLLCLYQAVFFGLFGMSVKFFMEIRKRFFFFLLAIIPALWTVSEWIRAEIPVMGFGWNLLAYSQAGNLWVIQSAKWIGAYGISFLVAFINAGVFLILRTGERNRKIGIAAICFSVFALNLVYGFRECRNDRGPSGPILRVAVVQGNIDQEEKWDAGLRGLILEKYLKLTELASFDDPDLTIWPEAAYPGFFNEDYSVSPVRFLAEQLKQPLLLGSPHREGVGLYMNSVYLLSAEGELKARYDKIHLVPFGEYIPFKPFLSFLEPYAYALGVSDFTAGKDFTIFELPSPENGPAVRLGTLICFEDVVPELARKFVRRGAQALVVLTNDAWFGKTAAPYQHLQASVFRAVENSVPVIRAANVGVSGFISSKGKVEDRVKNERAYDTWITGVLIRPVSFGDSPGTFYRKVGFLFPQICLAGLFPAAFWVWLGRKRKRSV